MKIFYSKGIRMLTVASLIILSTTAFSQVVTSNADAGPGTLRDAITQANATTDAVITFNLPVGSTTITLLTPLPAITGLNTSIQGYSQPGSVIGPIGASRTIVVELNCNGIAGNGLDIQVDGVTVSGLAIYKAGRNGIKLLAGVNVVKIWGCYIGTNATGTATGLSNTRNGIEVGDSSNINASLSTTITIGSDGDGAPANPPVSGGDFDEGNVIVGSGPAAPLSIRYNGVLFHNTTAARVSGNYVGIGADGTSKMGNALGGVTFMEGCIQNIVGVDDNTATDASQINYIGNNAAGVILMQNSNNNSVSGNNLGVNPDGSAAGNLNLNASNNPVAPIFGDGVMIWGSSSNIIGTNANGNADAAEANLIGFNVIGVFISADDPGTVFPPNANDASDNFVMGNLIGTGSDHSQNLAQRFFGVFVRAVSGLSAQRNIIGSSDDQNLAVANTQANTIFNSGVSGTGVDAPGNTGVADQNRISHNIFDNNTQVLGVQTTGLSIANTGTGTPIQNDCGDGDIGGNDRLNRPVITSVVSDATIITIKGMSAPNAVLEFYTTSGTTNFNGTTTKNFGELSAHLMTLVEGDPGGIAGFPDLDGTTTTYTDDGVATFAPCAINNFTFSFPLTALQGPYTPGNNVAAIAFDAFSGPANTSEPSAIVLSILPVKLTDFTGKLVNGATQLKWTTASENNSHYFDVERSADGAHFSAIGQVSAKGYSTVTTNYAFTDGAPLQGLNFYRLKQVDKDGKFAYSNVIVIRNNGMFMKTQIIPNPAHNMATISISLAQNENLQVRLIDATGKLARSYKFTGIAGENQFLINDLNGLPTGIYTIDIRGQQTSIQERLMKY